MQQNRIEINKAISKKAALTQALNYLNKSWFAHTRQTTWNHQCAGKPLSPFVTSKQGKHDHET